MTVGEKSSAVSKLAFASEQIVLQNVPVRVKRQAALCILDTVGCMVAGTSTAEAELLFRCEAGSQSASQVVVPGTAQVLDLYAALRVNGYLGDVLELNDLIGGHASIGTVTAALALAQMQASSGAALLEAVVRGIEITTRVYSAVYEKLKRYTEVGIVPVGIPSSIGAAAAASRLLELNHVQTCHAMAIAGGMAGWCPAEVIFGNGGTMKPLLFGAQPATVAVKAAFDARCGMTGPLQLLDSKLGYFNTVSVGGSLDTTLDHEWALASPRRKLHACCGYIHSPVDALVQLGLQIAKVYRDSTVQVYVAPYVADVVSKKGTPNSPNDARFHLQYCLAVVMQGEDVIRPEHIIGVEYPLQDSAIIEAMNRVTVVADPQLDHYHQCKVILTRADGQRFTHVLDGPRGSDKAPLSDDEVVSKFLSLTKPILGSERAAEVVAAVTDLETLPDVGELARLVAAPTC